MTKSVKVLKEWSRRIITTFTPRNQFTASGLPSGWRVRLSAWQKGVRVVQIDLSR